MDLRVSGALWGEERNEYFTLIPLKIYVSMTIKKHTLTVEIHLRIEDSLYTEISQN